MAREPRFRTKVWDAPLRLFHIALIILLCTSWASKEYHWGNLAHQWSGRSLAGLLIFRIFWGFFGSETSRFGHFLKSPLRALSYVKTLGRKEPDNQVGHNPLGGYMTILMLLLITAQVAMGLLATGRGGTHGPLAFLIPEQLSHRITGWHVWNVNLLIGVIAVHVLAILYYALFKKQNLVAPMISGYKRLPGKLKTPKIESPMKAVALLALSAMIVGFMLKIGQGR